MFPKTVQDPEYPSYKGSRNDGLNLVAEWQKNKKVNGLVIVLYVFIFVIDLPLGGHLNVNRTSTLRVQRLESICLCLFCLQNARYVWNKADFDAVNPAQTDFLLGKKN